MSPPEITDAPRLGVPAPAPVDDTPGRGACSGTGEVTAPIAPPLGRALVVSDRDSPAGRPYRPDVSR